MVTESLTTPLYHNTTVAIPFSATSDRTYPEPKSHDDRHLSMFQLVKMFIRYLQLLACVWCVVRASSSCTPSRVNSAVTQKAQDGRALCATSPPNETVTADAAIGCVAACLVHGSCKDGVNYRSDAELCELYNDPPTSFQVQPNCRYIKV